jgi:hypothetical protein
MYPLNRKERTIRKGAVTREEIDKSSHGELGRERQQEAREEWGICSTAGASLREWPMVC